METILAAAILRDGLSTPDMMPPPARHHDIIHALHLEGIGAAELGPDTQGFVTSTGRFVDRVAAYAIAKAAQQLISDTSCGFLTSEDVW